MAMAVPTSVTFQLRIGSGQHGYFNSAIKFHFVFGSVKLLTITRFQTLYIICEIIYLISLIELTGPGSPSRVYWFLYIVSGTLGFELLLWSNLSLLMWLAINLCLLLFALDSSGLLGRGYDWFRQFVQPLASSGPLMRGCDWFRQLVQPLELSRLFAQGHDWFQQLGLLVRGYDWLQQLVQPLASSTLLSRGYDWFRQAVQQFVQTLASSGLFARGYDWFRNLVEPLTSSDLFVRAYNWFRQLGQPPADMELPGV